MKLRIWRITLGFALVGLLFALVQVGLSLLYGASSSPVTQQHIASIGRTLLFTCPFAFGEMAMDNDKIPSDWVIFYIEMIGLNVALYSVVGLVCASIVGTLQAAWTTRPR